MRVITAVVNTLILTYCGNNIFFGTVNMKHFKIPLEQLTSLKLGLVKCLLWWPCYQDRSIKKIIFKILGNFEAIFYSALTFSQHIITRSVQKVLYQWKSFLPSDKARTCYLNSQELLVCLYKPPQLRTQRTFLNACVFLVGWLMGV